MDILSYVIGVTFLLFSVQLHSVQGVLVPCTHHEEVCECETTDDDCTFKLEIQELTTFTSFPLDNNGYLLDAPGTSYSVSDLNSLLSVIVALVIVALLILELLTLSSLIIGAVCL